jgi:hypothetical protein
MNGFEMLRQLRTEGGRDQPGEIQDGFRLSGRIRGRNVMTSEERSFTVTLSRSMVAVPSFPGEAS